MNSVKSLHTFALQANAESVHTVTSEKQLLSIIKECATIPLVILGQGSNTIFVEDFAGAVIVNQLLGKELIEEAEHFVLNVASGEDWHELVVWCMSQSIFGLENLALIPGTIGAAPIQNIGAYGIEVCEFISGVEYIDLKTGLKHKLVNRECFFGYRDSIFKHELKNTAFITSVELTIPKRSHPVTTYAPLSDLMDPTPQQVFELVCKTRKEKLPDPKLLGNAGSFFKNPLVPKDLAEALLQQYPTMPHYSVNEVEVKLAAGWLIEKSGLKGFCLENVCVHIKQALVLVNKSGNASGEELLQLVNVIQERVKSEFGVQLENEVRMIGNNGEILL